jgi:dipeptidase D
MPDPIDGDRIRADGPALGADNGIGVAAMLDLGEPRSVEHGPLELVFTVGVGRNRGRVSVC